MRYVTMIVLAVGLAACSGGGDENADDGAMMDQASPAADSAGMMADSTGMMADSSEMGDSGAMGGGMGGND